MFKKNYLIYKKKTNYTDALAEYWLSYPLDGDENLSLIQSLTQSRQRFLYRHPRLSSSVLDKVLGKHQLYFLQCSQYICGSSLETIYGYLHNQPGGAIVSHLDFRQTIALCLMKMVARRVMRRYFIHGGGAPDGLDRRRRRANRLPSAAPINIQRRRSVAPYVVSDL